MQIGIVFPQHDFNGDYGAIKEFAIRAEEYGFAHILAYDHVLGANPDRPGGWQGPYTYKHAFYEPFVLFSYMAGATETIEFTTGILILPQRETAVVAKQAATLDVLSNGRFRLGIGVGWNAVEYQALNQNFKTRGRRVESQINVMRQLWAEPLVTIKDEWHDIPDAGINPLPTGQIPIWLGGHADVVIERVARMADGWIPTTRTPEQAKPLLEKLDGYLAENGRSRDDVGLEAWIGYGDGNPDVWQQRLDGWRAANFTHISFNTLRHGMATPDEHFAAMEKMAQML